MSLKEQILYRAKAIAAATGIGVEALLAWLVETPDTAMALEKVIPAPYAQFVPLILGGIAATWLVHRVPNAAPVAVGADNDDLVTDATTAVPIVQTEDGVETGAGR